MWMDLGLMRMRVPMNVIPVGVMMRMTGVVFISQYWRIRQRAKEADHVQNPEDDQHESNR